MGVENNSKGISRITSCRFRDWILLSSFPVGSVQFEWLGRIGVDASFAPFCRTLRSPLAEPECVIPRIL